MKKANIKQSWLIFTALFVVLLSFVGQLSAQRHVPMMLNKDLYYPKKPGPYQYGLDLDKYIKSYVTTDTSLSIGGGGGTVAFEESVTYSQLQTLISGEDLVPGKKYLISDYKTTFLGNISGDPYTDASVEAIVVTALTDASLQPIAYSISNPNDIIYYDVTGDYVMGSTTGCITRRIDTKYNINVPFDFRWMKVELGYWSASSYDSGATYWRGAIVGEEGGAMYISLVDSNVDNSLADTRYWKLINNDGGLYGLGGEFENVFLNELQTNNIDDVFPLFPLENVTNFVIEEQPTNFGNTVFCLLQNCSNTTVKSMNRVFVNGQFTNNKFGKLSHVYYNQGMGYFSDNTMKDITVLIATGNFSGNVAGCDICLLYTSDAADD